MNPNINYSGSLKSPLELPLLIEETEDIAKILGWDYHIIKSEYKNHQFEKTIDDTGYGMVFIPLNCEPVSLVFDSEGKVFAPWIKDIFKSLDKGEVDNFKIMRIEINLDNQSVEPIFSENNIIDINLNDIIYNIPIKTNDLDEETYISLVHLLKYLGVKYFTDFKLNEEETIPLSEKIEFLNSTIQDMIDHNNPIFGNENDIFNFLKELITKFKKNIE